MSSVSPFALVVAAPALALVSLLGILHEGLYYMWYTAVFVWLLTLPMLVFRPVASLSVRRSELVLMAFVTAAVIFGTCVANVETYCADHNCQMPSTVEWPGPGFEFV